MSRRLIIATVLLAIIGGVLVGYVRGLPNDFVDGTTEQSAVASK